MFRGNWFGHHHHHASSHILLQVLVLGFYDVVNTSNIWRASFWSSSSLNIATLSHLLCLERISLGPHKASDLMQHLVVLFLHLHLTANFVIHNFQVLGF
jgi:hypothetical protein